MLTNIINTFNSSERCPVCNNSHCIEELLEDESKLFCTQCGYERCEYRNSDYGGSTYEVKPLGVKIWKLKKDKRIFFSSWDDVHSLYLFKRFVEKGKDIFKFEFALYTTIKGNHIEVNNILKNKTSYVFIDKEN